MSITEKNHNFGTNDGKENAKEGQNIQDSPLKGIVPEHLVHAKVVCLLSDGEMRIPLMLLLQCKLFRDWV